MKKIFSFLIARALALNLSTFAFAEQNVTNDQTTSINIVQQQSSPITATVNISTNDFVVVNAVDRNQIPAAESLTDRSSRTFQIFNQKISTNDYRTIKYSPPNWSNFGFEANANLTTQNNASEIFNSDRQRYVKRE